MASWQRDFASGLIVLVPLLVTATFLAWIFGKLAQVPIPLEPAYLRVGLTLVIFVLLVFSVGYLMRTAVGSVMESAIDDLMNQLPGLRVIYNASKMAVETALSSTEDLQQPVRIEMWNDIRVTAFKTGNKAPDGKIILFVPTAPNITSGYVIEVDEHQYTEIDESVESALTRLLSAGFGDEENDAVSAVFGSEQPVGQSDEVGTGDQNDTTGTPAVPDGDGSAPDVEKEHWDEEDVSKS